MAVHSDPSMQNSLDLATKKPFRLFRERAAVTAQTMIITVLLMSAAFVIAIVFNAFTRELPLMVFAAATLTLILWRGLLGGLAATLISALFMLFFFIAPQFSFSVVNTGELASVIIFIGCALLLSWIEAKRRDSREEQIRLDTRLQTLQELTLALSQALTPVQVARVILTKGVAALNADAGSVALLNEEETNLEILSAVGYETDVIASWREFPVDHAFAPIAQCVREKRLIWAGMNYRSHMEQDSRHNSWAAVPLIVDDEAIGGMGLSFTHAQPFTASERDFALTLGNHCAQALQRSLLTERIKQAVANEERQRLARDLHDAVSQSLFASTNIAEALQRTWQENPENVETHLGELVMLNRGALAEMRTLLLELRPDSITRYKLTELFRQLLDAARARREIEAQIMIQEPADPLPAEAHIALYRIAQEAINNVIKHSEATQVDVRLISTGEYLTLQVRDNGRGFAADMRAGLGMGTMRERAESIGAALKVASQPGVGTTIEVAWSPSLRPA